MSFEVPREFESWCAAAGAAHAHEARKRAEADTAKERARVLADARWAADRPLRRECGRAVLLWLHYLAGSGVRARLAAAGLESLELWGPFTADAQPTRRGTRDRRYRVPLAGYPALISLHHHGRACGRTTLLADEETFADTVPTAIALRMSRDVASGAVWQRVREALTAREEV